MGLKLICIANFTKSAFLHNRCYNEYATLTNNIELQRLTNLVNTLYSADRVELNYFFKTAIFAFPLRIAIQATLFQQKKGQVELLFGCCLYK